MGESTEQGSTSTMELSWHPTSVPFLTIPESPSPSLLFHKIVIILNILIGRGLNWQARRKRCEQQNYSEKNTYKQAFPSKGCREKKLREKSAETQGTGPKSPETRTSCGDKAPRASQPGPDFLRIWFSSPPRTVLSKSGEPWAWQPYTRLHPGPGPAPQASVTAAYEFPHGHTRLRTTSVLSFTQQKPPLALGLKGVLISYFLLLSSHFKR